MEISLINLETNQKIEVTGEEPTIIGRGDLISCSDKRISRKHGRLYKTSNGELHIVALHSNPCFFMHEGLPPIKQLKKDEDKILQNGDYIALLPDQFWFQVIINKKNDLDETFMENLNTSDLQNKTSIDSTPGKSNGTGITNLPVSPASSPVKNKTLIESTPEKSPPKSSGTGISNLFVSPSSSPVKNDFEPEPGCSKAGTLNLSPASSPVKNNESKAGCSTDNVVSNAPQSTCTVEKEEAGCSKQTKIRKLPEWMYEIEGDCGRDKAVKRTTKDVEDYEAPPKKTKSKESEESSPSPGASLTVNEMEVPQAAAITVNVPSTDSSSSVSKDGYESQVVEPPVMTPPDPNVTVTPVPQAGVAAPQQPAQPVVARAMCQYGNKCYRKNTQHKAEFAHPGDADYVPVQNRPVCPYGSMCYRQNPMHRTEYQHLPTTIAAPPATPAGVTTDGKRRRQQNNVTGGGGSSDEDEYDMDDPFLNDASSDEYVPTDELDSESEFDTSQDMSEDLTRLKKEAKKIIKAKRK